MYGRQVTDSVLETPAIDPAEKEKIRAVGYAEAQACVSVGISLGAMPLVAGLAALGVAVRAKKKLSQG
jgi:hypothetical protein